MEGKREQKRRRHEEWITFWLDDLRVAALCFSSIFGLQPLCPQEYRIDTEIHLDKYSHPINVTITRETKSHGIAWHCIALH